MLPTENSYGILKRFNFLKGIIEVDQPESVLDIGCGGGGNLTAPLAEYFPSIRFLGADSDLNSVNFAQNKNQLENLSFCLPEDINSSAKIDLIIASEVIEHVEDPLQFLFSLKAKLSNTGKLVLTLPNGYGPFEFMCLFESVLYFLGIQPIFRKVKSIFGLKVAAPVPENMDTLAVSPHINFFSYRRITRLISGAGLNVITYQPRTFLCGYGFDQLLRGSALIEWNTKIADYLPAFMSSDWMFELELGVQPSNTTYQRNMYARFRRYLNEKRSGLL